MRYVLAVIYSNFKTVAINDGSRNHRDPFGPLDERLMVRLERL